VEPVERPDGHRVEAASTDVGKHLVEDGAGLGGALRLLVEDDLKPASFGEAANLGLLVLVVWRSVLTRR